MEKLKAQDLRIGNLVTINQTALHFDGSGESEPIFEIGEIRTDLVYFKGFHTGEYCSSLQPIPLTEELLLKFGFHVDFRDEACVSFIHNKLDCDAIILDVPKKDFYFNTWEQSKAPQSVHQLQNLFYALTGEELECK